MIFFAESHGFCPDPLDRESIKCEIPENGSFGNDDGGGLVKAKVNVSHTNSGRSALV